MLLAIENFSLFGQEISKDSVSILFFYQYGLIGILFLTLLLTAIMVRLIYLDVFLVIVIFAISYSDTFIFPPTIFFFALVFRKSLVDLVSFISRIIFYRKIAMGAN